MIVNPVSLFKQSDVPIDLLDVDKNSAVVSFSECDSEVKASQRYERENKMMTSTAYLLTLPPKMTDCDL